MIQVSSLPFIITASISLFLGSFFLFLYQRLNSRHEETVYYYFVFSISALVSAVFLGAFAVLINSSENLDYLNVSNRVTIITSMFTLLLSMHFYISYFNYSAQKSLRWCYAISTLFSLLCLLPNQYFLDKAFYSTSQYYTGLAFGPLFQIWGVWILALSVYCMIILIQIYRLQQNNANKQSSQAVKLSLIAASIWMVTGLGDALTGIQIVDLPPLTWVGSFLVTCSIAWILIFHIDYLYEDRRLLSNRLMYDHLTQAFSRSYFEIRLSEAIQEMLQNDSNKLYLCIFDIDNFKSVNDNYGHANGDQLLKQISTITINAIEPNDCFARLGGDEFILLLIGRKKDEQAVAVLEGIRKHIAETSFGIAPYDFKASCSFGMVKSGPEHLKVQDLENQLLSHADQALYSSKYKGKNTISVSTLSVADT